jgi:hypothetical protein
MSTDTAAAMWRSLENDAILFGQEAEDVDREEALAAFAAMISDVEWPDSIPPPYQEDTILLPPSILEEIMATDLPVGVIVGIGAHRNDAIEIFWEGRLVRNEDGSFTSFVSHEFSPEYWVGAVSARFYLDLVHKCVQSMVGTLQGLTVDEFDDSSERMVHLEYSFPVEAMDLNLSDIFDKAVRIQHDLELPADLVVDDVTKALARSADRILRGHYAKISELVARVDAAESPADKGSSLESLMEALFAQVPGFVVFDRDLRTATEEVDLVIVNDSPDPVFSRDGMIILVECKNWTARPGRPDFSNLEIKVQNRHNRCSLAFFVSWSGFAETVSLEALRLSRQDYVIVCLIGSDVRRAALAGEFPEFLRQATLQAVTR